MSRISRFEGQINKLEKKLEKHEEKMQILTDQFHQKKISEHTFSVKKDKIVDQIRGMKARIRLFQGGIMKERKYLQEKEKEEEK